jgi:hypothetical protein
MRWLLHPEAPFVGAVIVIAALEAAVACGWLPL